MEKLNQYRAKRNFYETPEPESGTASDGSLLYVIQEHHATTLHWDLRLELDGVLLSWAITKEPPTEHGTRRLAVHVEDHPLDYGSFEGIIPKGNYGAGSVKIWDKGSWAPINDPRAGLKEGKLELQINGERLNGMYVLVKTDSVNWLFMKMKSKVLRRTEMPENIKPQLCETRERPPEGPGWVHEIKWDGYRAIAYIRDGAVSLESRNGNELRIPVIEQALGAVKVDAIIDGEVVAFDAEGRSNFGILQQSVKSKRLAALEFVAFDLLFINGEDLRHLPLKERKKRLEFLIRDLQHVRFSAGYEGSGAMLFEQACANGLEGIISKRNDRPYVSKRTTDWVKARCESVLGAYIVGFTMLNESHNMMGALLLATKDEAGNNVYVGKVGTGFSDAQRHKYFLDLSKLETEKPPFDEKIDRKGVTFVRPETEVAVKYLAWSLDGKLRQPRLVDKKHLAKEGKVLSTFTLTHPERVVDAQSGATKQDLADYIQFVNFELLSELSNRPLSLVRAPGGVDSEQFFQKRKMQGFSDDVLKIPLKSDDDDSEGMMIKNLAGLMSLVQMGAIEFHPWGSRVDDLERPDRLVFDLDPDPDLPWGDVVHGAEGMRRQLAELKLECFAKVTGGKGIHVLVPIKPEFEWKDIKLFCHHFVDIRAKKHPKRYTASISKADRTGRIFLDYLRNSRGATAVAAYSPRARNGLTVAMPIAWEDLLLTPPGTITVLNARQHLESRKSDPWQWMKRASGQSLKSALGL